MEEDGRPTDYFVCRGRQSRREQDTHAPVAIKAVVRSKLTAKLLENLESEISILKRIVHHNIVELKDCLVSLLPDRFCLRLPAALLAPSTAPCLTGGSSFVKGWRLTRLQSHRKPTRTSTL